MITSETYNVCSTETLENWLDNYWQDFKKKPRQTMTFKALIGQLPSYLTDLFTKCENENYHLRSNNTKLFLPRQNTNFLKIP